MTGYSATSGNRDAGRAVRDRGPARAAFGDPFLQGRAWRVLPILAVVIFGATFPSRASSPAHPHDDIVAMVEGAALSAAESEGLEDIEVRVHPLDPRLRPALCDRPLDVIRPHAGRALGPVSYGVRCGGSIPWTLYLRAEVSAALSLPVLRSSLPRGALIAENDLEMTTRRITARAVDLIVDPARAVGMELQRPLAAGSPLRHGQVARPQLVERGQTVTLIAGARVSGTAR